jgi:hypothetical protein
MSEYQKGEVLWKVTMAAAYLSMHPKTLYKKIREGKLFDPLRIIHIGDDIRIPRDEVFRVAEGIKKTIYTNAE